MSVRFTGSGKAPSLLTRMVLSIMAVILLVFAFHAVYVYSTQRAVITEAISQDVSESLKRLSENIAPFMESYSVNEYEKLVATEIALKEHFAVVVEDYEMGEILGDSEYVSGQVRTDSGDYTPYQQEDPSLNERLEQAFYSDSAPISGPEGEVIGRVSVYASDAPLVSKLHSALIEELVTILVLSLALSLLLIIVLRRFFLRSIKHIDAAIRHCDQDGIPLNPLPEAPYREVDVLTRTINTMLESIKESKARRKIERIRLENTITGTRTGTWEWNIKTGETAFNERWAEIVGYSLEELEPISIKTWEKLADPDDLKRSSELLEKHFRGELSHYECETRMRHKDGHWVWVLDRGSVMSWTEDGQPLMMYGTHQDISRQKEIQEKLSLAAGVFKYAREGIVLTSTEGVILDVNSAFRALTGFARRDVIHQDYTFLASGRHSQEFYDAVLASLQEEGVWVGECWVPCQDGEAFPSLMTIAAVRDNTGEVQHYVTLIADISSLKKNEEKLREIAHYDSLTGLPNRMLLTERLRQSVAMARRRREMLAVVFLDLDGFKEVNDTFGHAAGDELLVILAERMKETLRECDTIARLGGDEFVVLLPDLSGRQDCDPVLTRLLDALSAPVRLAVDTVQVSASVGVSLYPQNPDVDADILIRQADMAMYQAKNRGKNHYRFFSNASFDAAASQGNQPSSDQSFGKLSGEG